ncbi:transcriptional regulator [Streptomyces pluripotens]|uniref:Transcriptional regulator n=1 Tax=Streptomyces pluripotens TaxID=1355015 RepID=A0A221P823_9ACTN|nr:MULTISPECIES: LCP family protein [Streptomyces]ARP73698.1 transcriptional regulator [Streptomyces pluripotens]ASN27945.1 transcriptional regulator [Streptomyces pluripotens]KIE24344.1 transcriptional regulator [Streptomyces sp. MUSC 125]MCH0559446.1 LCP family protein [Streptomyces sp. MUM 16J]
MSLLILVTAGVGWWFYQHLNGNIHSVSLDGKGGTEKADAFGRTPINILVMGSDGRTSKADCKLGGGCSKTGVQTGSNADVQMVVHISADRSNATVMSIPRDTMTRIPACRNSGTDQSTPGYYGQINSALQYGPACQVATVHQLTGIPIDHFVKLDFSGVVKMSDAVGGVPVCVSDDVYDTYSHLKLSKGTHTLKGVAALEFVRSRHGFGDGSDLGRTISQHLFLGAMIRKFKSAGTLTDPTAVYALADAATKALTVDDGLGTVKKLIGLAADLDKVPAKRITFATMQTAPDPADSNRVVVGPGARTLFSTIADDQSLTTGSGKKSVAASATAKATATAPAVPASEIAVTVENGTSITGRASAVATVLTDRGFSLRTTTANAPSLASTTTLTYGAGRQAEAKTVAAALGLSGAQLKQGTGTGLTLVIGSDWPSGTRYHGGSSSPAPADTKAAVDNAHASTAGQAKTCAKVSPYKTVTLNGISMTPSQAYAAARGKPDSDA